MSLYPHAAWNLSRSVTLSVFSKAFCSLLNWDMEKEARVGDRIRILEVSVLWF